MSSAAASDLSHLDPADADAVYRACLGVIGIGREADVLEPVARALTRHPNDARLHQIKGLAHRGQDELAEALAAFERAAALAPGDPLLAHSVARVTMEAGLPASHLFARTLQMAPGQNDLLLGMAAALLAEGRIDAAIAGLEATLRAVPLWLPGLHSLSHLRWLRGERASFADGFAAAVMVAPRDIQLWRQWIDTLMHADQHEAALDVLTRARATAGDHMVFDALDAVIRAERGETELADRLFAALGPIGHITMAARYLRHLLRAGRPQEAAAFVEPWLAHPEADLVWPYAATAWRLTGDARWHWLEGDERQVGVYDLAGELPDLPALAERLRSIHQALGQPLEQSVRGGTQTDGPLFARIEPEIRALRAVIVAAVQRHIAQLPPPEPGHPTLRPVRAPVRFSGSWSVRLPGAGFHSNHVHPAGWLSSAFYVALPDDLGDGEAGWLTLGQPQAELGLDLAPFRTIEPKPGRLALFPSTMWHGTIPFAAGERLTVAFDVARQF